MHRYNSHNLQVLHLNFNRWFGAASCGTQRNMRWCFTWRWEVETLNRSDCKWFFVWKIKMKSFDLLLSSPPPSIMILISPTISIQSFGINFVWKLEKVLYDVVICSTCTMEYLYSIWNNKRMWSDASETSFTFNWQKKRKCNWKWNDFRYGKNVFCMHSKIANVVPIGLQPFWCSARFPDTVCPTFAGVLSGNCDANSNNSNSSQQHHAPVANQQWHNTMKMIHLWIWIRTTQRCIIVERAVDIFFFIPFLFSFSMNHFDTYNDVCVNESQVFYVIT